MCLLRYKIIITLGILATTIVYLNAAYADEKVLLERQIQQLLLSKPAYSKGLLQESALEESQKVRNQKRLKETNTIASPLVIKPILGINPKELEKLLVSEPDNKHVSKAIKDTQYNKKERVTKNKSQESALLLAVDQLIRQTNTIKAPSKKQSTPITTTTSSKVESKKAISDKEMHRFYAYLHQQNNARKKKSSYQAENVLQKKLWKAIKKAKTMVNVPYVWGGTTPKGFDCSGLVQYTYRYAGIKLPRTAATQYRATKRTSLAKAKPGDLLFFHTPQPRKVYVNHVGIYLGNDRFLHAPGFGTKVTIDPLDALWKMHIVGIGRPT